MFIFTSTTYSACSQVYYLKRLFTSALLPTLIHKCTTYSTYSQVYYL